MKTLNLAIVQMQDVAAYIESHINEIKSILMLTSDVVGDGEEEIPDHLNGMSLPSIQSYFARMHANEKLNYTRIHAIIDSIGTKLANLNTKMDRISHTTLYHKFWEEKLLHAIVGLVLLNSDSSNIKKLMNDSNEFTE